MAARLQKLMTRRDRLVEQHALEYKAAAKSYAEMSDADAEARSYFVAACDVLGIDPESARFLPAQTPDSLGRMVSAGPDEEPAPETNP